MTNQVKSLVPPGYTDRPYHMVCTDRRSTGPSWVELVCRRADPEVLEGRVAPLLGSRVYNSIIMLIREPWWVELLQEQLEEPA